MMMSNTQLLCDSQLQCGQRAYLVHKEFQNSVESAMMGPQREEEALGMESGRRGG